MASDWHLIQIRIGQRLKNQIKTLAEKHEYSNADIARGALEFGVQISEKLFEAQEIIIKEYIRLLRNQNRKRTRITRQPEQSATDKPIDEIDNCQERL